MPLAEEMQMATEGVGLIEPTALVPDAAAA
jgi:hypothetical protein